MDSQTPSIDKQPLREKQRYTKHLVVDIRNLHLSVEKNDDKAAMR